MVILSVQAPNCAGLDAGSLPRRHPAWLGPAFESQFSIYNKLQKEVIYLIIFTSRMNVLSADFGVAPAVQFPPCIGIEDIVF